jgi:hypothetical protein
MVRQWLLGEVCGSGRDVPQSLLEASLARGRGSARIPGLHSSLFRYGRASAAISGVFGAGKIFTTAILCAFLAQVAAAKVIWVASQNEPLVAAIGHIRELLKDADEEARNKFTRLPARYLPSACPLDILYEERFKLKKKPLMCLLMTDKSTQLEMDMNYSRISSMLYHADIVVKDEAQTEGAPHEIALQSKLPFNCLLLRMGDAKQPTAAPGPSDEQRKLAGLLTRKPVGLRNLQHASTPIAILMKMNNRMELQGYRRRAFAEPSRYYPSQTPEDHVPLPFAYLCSILANDACNITWPLCSSMLDKEGLPRPGLPEPLSLSCPPYLPQGHKLGLQSGHRLQVPPSSGSRRMALSRTAPQIPWMRWPDQAALVLGTFSGIGLATTSTRIMGIARQETKTPPEAGC